MLGLLVLGVVLFAGVLVHNRLQERAVRRDTERSFAPRHADALLDGAARRAEPVLERSRPGHEATPDARVDYVIELQFARPLAAAEMLEGWRPLEQRFARRALLAPADGGAWHAGLQLVSRAGVVSEAELIEFRSGVETLAAGLGGASVFAPEMRHALEAARALDRLCADCDIQVALRVLGEGIGVEPDAQPFRVVREESGVALVLDVALTPELGRSYEAMVRAGRTLAESHNGSLVDDEGRVLDERSLAAIGAQLEAVRQMLAGHGIETGSPLALRLFS